MLKRKKQAQRNKNILNSKKGEKMIKFYGKTCNYAFPYGIVGGYHIFFLGDGHEEFGADFDDIDSCILWAAYQEFVEKNADIGTKNALICEKGSGRLAMWITSRDRLLEYAWLTLTDVNIDEKERTEQDWFVFPAGADREVIWHWFDDHYGSGVAGLLYGEAELPLNTMLPWRHKEQLIPWVFVSENGVKDEDAYNRVKNSFMLVMQAELYIDDDYDIAVLLAPSGTNGTEELTAILAGDTNSGYTVYIYDSDELFSTGDNVAYIKTKSIREAATIVSQMLLNNIQEKEERLDAIRKRYLKA